MPEKVTVGQLSDLLFRACDNLRGDTDAAEYRELTFGMLILKRLSDRFDQDRERLTASLTLRELPQELIERHVRSPDRYEFFVPDNAHWSQINQLKSDVGTALNNALESLDDANSETLHDVLRHIDFNRKVGRRSLDDDTLTNLIQNFDKIPLRDENLESPGVLGAASESLIKFFAKSSGKKVGDIHTPPEIARTLVAIVDPQPRMSIYDPTAGSGSMIIQTRDYVNECGGDSSDLTFAGQVSSGSTRSICKMNLLLHRISYADIRQGDTLRQPQHREANGELTRFDCVLANPPFGQNYLKQDIESSDRFDVWMHEKGKKACLMFVQHMLAVLKPDGRMATIMPRGVLFRGGEEREARRHFIERGWLDAVIGLPAGLFYGITTATCVLVMNKNDATLRRDVLFIDAGREYREEKTQKFLRAEDVSKIVETYRGRQDVPGYARLVPVSEIEAEEWNCNVRRYVDNPPRSGAARRPRPTVRKRAGR